MKQSLLKTTLLLLVTLNLTNPLFAANTQDWKLSLEGLGPIKIGMTTKEAEAASGQVFNATKPDSYEHESCYNLSFKGMKNLSFMMEAGKIVRINISSPAFATSTGAKIGDTEAQVQAFYKGKLVTEKHRYDEKGHYLTLIEKPQDRAIRFETDGKVISLIYAGKNEQVHYVEDCL